MEYIAIAKITNTHGIKGALKVKTDSDFKVSRYQKGNELYIAFKGNYIPVIVEGYFEKKGFDIVTFEEFNAVEDVEKYKGCTLFVSDEDREPLPEDEFYFSDLIGLEVYFKDGFVGKVSDVRDFPQSAMLVITTDKEKPSLVPFLKQFVLEVTSEKIVLVNAEDLV